MERMEAELEIVARFPDQLQVRLHSIGKLAEDGRTADMP